MTATTEALPVEHVLDNPVWHALAGPQRHFGTSTWLAARFDPEVSPFGALYGAPTDDHWQHLAAIVGPERTVVLTGGTPPPPPGWTVGLEVEAVQMVGDGVHAAIGAAHAGSPPTGADLLLGSLGTADVSDMLALVAGTRPGPFLARTVELGGYLGVRDGDRLVAMAGERLRLPGYTEISAVATDPAFRRRGLAQRLVLAVSSAIVHRRQVPFLHVSAVNTDAIRLYQSLGFTLRRSVRFVLIEAPPYQGQPVKREERSGSPPP